MYEEILVPLDGSEVAEVALPYAEELAIRLGSKVILLRLVAPVYHVYPSGEAFAHVPYTDEEMQPIMAEAKSYLEGVACRLKDRGVTTEVESIVRVGRAAEQIADRADRRNVGLIVIATHGRSGVKRWVLGSVADKVLRVAKQPVMLIRAKDGRPVVREKDLLGKILVTLDGSKESESVLPFIEELASRLKLEVTLFRVVAPVYHVFASFDGISQVLYTKEEMKPLKVSAEAYLEKAATGLRGKGITVKSEVRIGATAEEIIKLADETHSDMVVMSTHGRSGVGRWVFGSAADKVLNAGNTPVLLVRVP